MKVPWADDDVASLRREIDELRSRLARLESRLDDRLDRIEDDVRQRPVGSGRVVRRSAGPPADMYDLQDWVEHWFSRILERRVSNTRRWCPQWYNHPEVVTRLWVLYHSYHETMLYEDATGQSQWFIEHLDKHLDFLLSSDGPFAGCSPQRHSPARGLEVRRAPEGVWGPRLKDLSGNDSDHKQLSPS
jgi:hypothetical protein